MIHLMLLADIEQGTGLLDRLLRPEVLVFCIPIVAIVGAFAYKITKTIIAHRERMARIEHGVEPDSSGRGA